MGAQVFVVESSGEDAKDAFHNAVQEAKWACGHEGYTGTIAEKESFTMIPLPKSVNPHEFAGRLDIMDPFAWDHLLDEVLAVGDDRINDKWGPAGCFELTTRGNERQFLFFGWASC